MSSTGHAVSAAVPGLSDRYISLLGLVLIGYAFFGKSFAYIGAPPLYIGDITLFLGVVALLWGGCGFAVLASLPAILLLALMGWVTARTLPYVSAYGFDALRDSVIVMYGLYAFVVTGLILEKPSRIRGMLSVMSVAAAIFVPAILLLLPLSNMEGILPVLPGTEFPILSVRGSEASVHLLAATLLLMLGLRRVTVLGILFTILAFALIASQNRGGILAIGLPLMTIAILAGRIRELLLVMLIAVAALAVAYAVDLEIPMANRNISVHQLVDNIASIFNSSDVGTLDHSKQWRLTWWERIYDYTFHGEYFWTGKGFGVNIAESDGYVGDENPNLRSPHSGHLTILARAGVPGLVLWGLLLCAWGTMLVRGFLVARFAGHHTAACLFLLVLGYGAAFIINASFEVALEGPMQGIWFWCVFGFGLGLAMAYRADPRLVDEWSLGMRSRRDNQPCA